MKAIKITPITKKIVVRFSKKNVELPVDIQTKVDVYWDELIASGKMYQRGEVFTVTQKEMTGEGMNILVEKTDYAHYLYCQNIDDLGKNGVHIIHTAALVETSDGYTVFGEMGHQTSRAGIYQLCGGGIDNDDLRGDYFDFTHNISKELLEELGIDVTDKSRVSYFDEAYLKDGGPMDKITVIYKVVLVETKSELLEKYDKFVARLNTIDELPEFEKLSILKYEGGQIKNFFVQNNIVSDEYMQPLFSYIIDEVGYDNY